MMCFCSTAVFMLNDYLSKLLIRSLRTCFDVIIQDLTPFLCDPVSLFMYGMCKKLRKKLRGQVLNFAKLVWSRNIPMQNTRPDPVFFQSGKAVYSCGSNPSPRRLSSFREVNSGSEVVIPKSKHRGNSLKHPCINLLANFMLNCVHIRWSCFLSCYT